jgi:DeoR family transcriptional regulator of aga operon
LIGCARRVVVIADSSKIGQAAFARICGLDRVDELITDGLSGEAGREAIREAGVAVTLV